jgi:hypothetical protein
MLSAESVCVQPVLQFVSPPPCHASQAAGQQGDTAPPPPEQDVDLHFIAFVEHDGEPGPNQGEVQVQGFGGDIRDS